MNTRVKGYLSYESADEERTNDFNQAGSRWLQEQLRLQQIRFDTAGYEVSIPQGLYTEPVDWIPQVDAQVMPFLLIELTDEQQSDEQFLQQATQIHQLLIEQAATYAEVYVSLTREYDNRDGAKEGYAPIYYEGIYSARFTPDTEKITLQ